MKTLLLTLTVFAAMAVGLPAGAAIRSEQDAARIAASFYRKSHQARFNSPGVHTEPTLAYTSTSKNGIDCFYIFNNSNEAGFTIVSADTSVPEILGWCDYGSFDFEEAPLNVRWMLNHYSARIVDVINHPPVETTVMSPDENREDIPALMSSKWAQGAPYNNDCPAVGQGHAVVGCAATAMAQIMRYHRYPAAAKGTGDGVDLSGYTFDYDDMLDSYAGVDYTDQQADAVAELSRVCGLACEMNYGASVSTSAVSQNGIALIENFGYSTQLQVLYRNYYSYNEWTDLMYAEMAAGRPVLYTGQSSSGGHAFVCDGYSEGGYFHINWGWGGKYDGYFLLDALSPKAGGIGSYASGYNATQIVFTHIMKPTADDPTTLPTALFVNGNFAFNMYNSSYQAYSFNVSEATYSQNYFYNPLPWKEVITTGVKVVSDKDPSNVEYVKSVTNAVSLQSGQAFTTVNVRLDRFADGNYKVYPAYMDDSGVWKDADVMYSYQKYVSMRVINGTVHLTNDDLHSSEATDIVVHTMQVIGTPTQNGHAVLRFTLSNLGNSDYSGDIMAILTKEGASIAAQTLPLNVDVPAMSTRVTDVDEMLTCAPGTYDVTFSNGPDMFDGLFKLTVLDPVPTTSSSPLTAISCGPVSAVAGEKYTMVITISNGSDTDMSKPLIIYLYNEQTGKKVVARQTAISMDFPSYESEQYTLVPFTLNVPAGHYYWKITDDTGDIIGNKFPLDVVSGPFVSDGITYYIDDASAGTGYVCKPIDGEYSGDVVVPEEVDGTRITRILGGTFTFASDMTSLVLPKSVTMLSYGSLLHCVSLESLTLMSPTPIVVRSRAFNEDVKANLKIDVPYGSANLYARAEGWNEFNWGDWTINFSSGISLDSESELVDTNLTSSLTGHGLLLDPETSEPYEPYYVGYSETPEFDVDCSDINKCVPMISVNGISTQSDIISDSVKLPPLYEGEGVCNLDMQTSLTSIDVDQQDTEMDWYSIDGILVHKSLTKSEANDLLPAGIYIANGATYLLAK